MSTAYRPELLYSEGRFISNAELLVAGDGHIAARSPEAATVVELPGKALLPGFVNAHSHAFQRLIRGKSESRAGSGRDFWSWRGTMYHAASRLGPGEVYDVARMAFLEMALAGITTVGEFHYLHNSPDGSPYDDPNLLARQVIEAAQSVGIRIVLLRTAYLRSGFGLPPDPGQIRFFETARAFLANLEGLLREYPGSAEVSAGVAPHSIRAVPFGDLQEIVAWGRAHRLPVHMHISEQVAENEASLREHGATPVSLMARSKMLGPDWTAVHATHITPEETSSLAEAGATICACPTTERNLGDGIVAADAAMREGIRFALGSDSQAQIDPLEDARELEYHLRLRDQQRAILDWPGKTSMAARLLEAATVNGARALGVSSGALVAGSCADFFTIDLRDASVAGHSAADLLPLIVFGLNRTAIRDVAVNGRMIVRDGRHEQQEAIVARYAEIHEKVWREAPGAAR